MTTWPKTVEEAIDQLLSSMSEENIDFYLSTLDKKTN